MAQILLHTEFEGNMISHSSEVKRPQKLSELWDSGWPQTLDEFERFVNVFQKNLTFTLEVHLLLDSAAFSMGFQ